MAREEKMEGNLKLSKEISKVAPLKNEDFLFHFFRAFIELFVVRCRTIEYLEGLITLCM